MKNGIFFYVLMLCLIDYVVEAQNNTTSRPRCPKREKWVQCGTCEPTCDNQTPICTMGSDMTALVCLPARCQCKKQFVRNNATGECVSRKQCSNINLGGPMIPANQPGSRSSDDREKRQAPIGIPVQIGTTTINTPGGLKINPGGPMIPNNQSSSESESDEVRGKRQAPIGISVQIGTTTTFPPGALQINPGGSMISANGPGSCKENEIWQTCNPCEKTCQVPNFVCPTQQCPSTFTTTLTPSPLRIGSYGPFVQQGRCVCRPDKARSNNGRCVDLNECNSTSSTNSTCNCPPGQNCETLPCLTPPCPTRCVNRGGIPPANGGTEFNGQGQPGFPQTQFRQPRQYDQTGQVQQPGYGANINPNQMSYGPNPYLTNNIPPEQR